VRSVYHNWIPDSTPNRANVRENGKTSQSFATYLLKSGYDIHTVQELLGRKDVKTTMIYTYVLNRGLAVRSPLDET
jgi:site-specific recombinase XerD